MGAAGYKAAGSGPEVIPGDCNGDGCVNGEDVAILCAAFGCSENEGCYDARADFDHDGVVGAKDFAVLAAHYGEGCAAALSSSTKAEAVEFLDALGDALC